MWCPCDHKPTYTSAKFPPLVLGSRNTSRFCNHIPSLQIDWYFRTISNPSPWSIPVWCVFLLISCEHFSCSKFSAMMLAFPECTGYRSVLHANLNLWQLFTRSMCTSCVDNCRTSAVNSLNSHRVALRSWMISATQASLTCIQKDDTLTGQSQDLIGSRWSVSQEPQCHHAL